MRAVNMLLIERCSAWARALQTGNLVRRAEPKPDPDAPGAFLPNGAAAKSGLTKSILDAGWQTLITLVCAKAADAARTVVLVNPAYTSRTCSGCGHVLASLALAEREHVCPACGVISDRDVNAAINILRAGTALRQASA
jgi:putative transposase